jgi:hypothetical protein
MPINDAPVAPPPPVPVPGTPFRGGTVPPPLSWPETLPVRPGAPAPSALPPPQPAALPLPAPAASEPVPAKTQ